MSNPPVPERVEYGASLFDSDSLTEHPLTLFGTWFGEAVAAGVPEANGACLCTSDPDSGPDGRIVLMKDFSSAGLSFFTNYSSSKGQQLQADPRACLVFWWQPLRRQVRVRGPVERLTAAESDGYFLSRPRETGLGAWASAQSRPITDRAELDRRVAAAVERFHDQEVVPRPDHWGGYRLIPREVEFWQGRDSRLHDRFLYRHEGIATWSVQRLMP